MVEQPPRSCIPLGTPSRWWGCYAIYLRSSRLPTRQLCVRCAQAYTHRGIQHIRDAFGFCRCIVTKLAHSFLLCSCHLFLSLWSSAIFYSINSPNSTHPDITVPEPLLNCWGCRYAVLATKKYSGTTISQAVQSFRWKGWFYQCFSACVGATDVWSRSSFQVTTCTFFSADVGKTVDLVPVDDSPFTDCKQTRFCCQRQWKFSRSLFCLLNITGSDPVQWEFLLASGPRVQSMISSKSHKTLSFNWYLVLGKHLPVKKRHMLF